MFPTIAQYPAAAACEKPAGAAPKALMQAITHDPKYNPERTDATLARVREVIDAVLGAGTRADAVADACTEAAGPAFGPYTPLCAEAGGCVAATLAASLTQDEIRVVTSRLMESELSTDEVISLHKEFKVPVSRLEDDMLPVSGFGAKIADSKGNVYVDLDSNYSATNLGNSNLEIALGLFNQASTLISMKEDRIQVARARFLKEIGGMLPEGLDRFYWQNSGGEAVDKALKIAKAYTGQTGVIAFEGGFHGRTHGAIAVTHKKEYREPFGLHDLPWVHFAPYNDASAVGEILAAGKAKIVIIELVQGEESGVRPAAPEFVIMLRKLCDEHGAVLIADEVQTGFGRVSTGKGKWFASQVYGVTPDIMVVGKSFGGGFPVTAVVTTKKISAAMKPGYDGSTFGGNPMAMTSALIATRQMKALDLPVKVSQGSKLFKEGLAAIKSPLMKGFRCAGLMIGIELMSAECVAAVQEFMAEHGAFGSLSTGAIMRWMPPLVITKEEIATVLGAFEAALGWAESMF